MEKISHICDHCEADVNGSGYQVCVSYKNAEDGLLELHISNNVALGRCPASAVEYHYCGRNCLMLEINKIIDSITKQGSAAQTASAPKG